MYVTFALTLYSLFPMSHTRFIIVVARAVLNYYENLNVNAFKISYTNYLTAKIKQLVRI